MNEVQKINELERTILEILAGINNKYCIFKIEDFKKVYDLENFCKSDDKAIKSIVQPFINIAVEMVGLSSHAKSNGELLEGFEKIKVELEKEIKRV